MRANSSQCSLRNSLQLTIYLTSTLNDNTFWRKLLQTPSTTSVTKSTHALSVFASALNHMPLRNASVLTLSISLRVRRAPFCPIIFQSLGSKFFNFTLDKVALFNAKGGSDFSWNRYSTFLSHIHSELGYFSLGQVLAPKKPILYVK